MPTDPTPATAYHRVAASVLHYRSVLLDGPAPAQRLALIALSNLCLEEAALLPAPDAPAKPKRAAKAAAGR